MNVDQPRSGRHWIGGGRESVPRSVLAVMLMRVQVMSQTSSSADSRMRRSSPFDRLECVAHNCPLLLRNGPSRSLSSCISMLAAFRRHLVGKILRNGCHCNVA